MWKQKKIKKFLKKKKLISLIIQNINKFYNLYRNPKYKPKIGFYFKGLKSMENNLFEKNIKDKIIENIINTDHFINIGANYGYYCIYAFKNNKFFSAFEPNIANIKILIENFSYNSIKKNFNIFPLALSNRNGLIELYGEGTGSSLIEGWNEYYNKKIVPVTQFDNFNHIINRNLKTFILVDAEGNELNILFGAKYILERYKNLTWMIEICPNTHSKTIDYNNSIKVFNIMLNYGYNIFYLDKKFEWTQFNKNLQDFKNLILNSESKNFIFKR